MVLKMSIQISSLRKTSMIFRGKKGVSHLEMILSFVIFVGFMLFLLAIINPFKIIRSSDVYLDIIEREIVENISIKINFQTLKLDISTSSCFCFNYGFKNVIVKDKSYVKKKALTNGKLCIEHTDLNNNFYYIYSSQEFDEYNTGFDPVEQDCRDLATNEYSLGLFRVYDFSSFYKLKKLHDFTRIDYETIKEQFGLSFNRDFAFSVKDTENNIILNISKEVGRNIRVMAKEVPIHIVYYTG